MNRKQLVKILDLISVAPSMEAAIEILQAASKKRFIKGAWKKYFPKLIDGLANNKPFFSIIAKKGNSKLPFYAFSSLPLYSCDNAGLCKEWCYSLKAWRYPCATYRQIQNYLLMKFNKTAIIESFNEIPNDSTFRLYVDGDFKTREDVLFWFGLLRSNPTIKTYGYSKSWDLIESCSDFFPSNYRLNISSGGGEQLVTKDRMIELSTTRGEFIAVKIPEYIEKSSKRFALPEYHQAVREAGKALTGVSGFSCPGKCGTCASGNHACGNDKFKNIPIFIGVH